jgi:ADP-ribose pyrophosphatase
VATAADHLSHGRGQQAELEVVWVAFDDLLEAVLDQRVREGPLVAAVLAYDALRRRGEL